MISAALHARLLCGVSPLALSAASAPLRVRVAQRANECPARTVEHPDASEQLPALHLELISAKRNIALADDKLLTLGDEALRLKSFVASGEIAKPDVVDVLCNAAHGNGLYERHRRDEIEHIVGMSLSGVKKLASFEGVEPLSPARAKAQRSASNGRNSASKERTPQTLDRALIVRCASEIEPENIVWLWEGRIPRGTHTTIAGDPGTGKSQLLISVAAIVTTGGNWPCGEGRASIGNVIILSAEDSAPSTVIPRLLAAGADLTRVHVIEGTADDKGKRTFNLQTDLDLLEQKIAEIGDVHLVGIDPVSSYMGGGVDSHKNAEVRRVLAPIGEMAERTHVAILTVTHFSKGGTGSSTKALYRFIGSIAFTAAPRAAFVVMEDPDDIDRRLFLHGKNNLAKLPQGLAFRLVQQMVGGDKSILASSVAWESQPVSVTADEALRTGGNDEPTSMDDAVELLRTVLINSPVRVGDVETEARTACLLGEDQSIGQSKPFRNARKALGVVSRKAGMGEGWVWALPKTPSEFEDAL